MALKKKILITLIFIFLFFMSSAFAIYLSNLDVSSKITIKENLEEQADFEIDYEILSQNLILEKTEYVIDFTIHYLGSDPLYFWNLNFNVPEDIEVNQIVSAEYVLEENNIINVSNLPEMPGLLNNDEVTFTLIFVTSQTSYYPNTFAIGDYIVKEVLRAKLRATLNQVSVSGNIYTYNINIENSGNINAENWRLSLTSHNELQIKSLPTNINYIQQTEKIILSNKAEDVLNVGDTLVINFSYMSNLKNWYPEIVFITADEQVI